MSHEKTIVSGKKTRMASRTLKERRADKRARVGDVKTSRKGPRWRK